MNGLNRISSCLTNINRRSNLIDAGQIKIHIMISAQYIVEKIGLRFLFTIWSLPLTSRVSSYKYLTTMEDSGMSGHQEDLSHGISYVHLFYILSLSILLYLSLLQQIIKDINFSVFHRVFANRLAIVQFLFRRREHPW